MIYFGVSVVVVVVVFLLLLLLFSLLFFLLRSFPLKTTQINSFKN